jgi:hypothetical protein
MKIESVINQEGINFDRYLGTTLVLPWPEFEEIKIQPNDTAIAPVIDLAFKKLYDNFLYLYKSSRVASNIIPVTQVATAGLSALPECIVEGLTIKIAYSDTEGPCPGGHVCNAATYDFYMNGIYLGEVNLNNSPGGGDRESTFILTKSQAEAIAAVSPIVTFGIFCNVPPDVDLGWGLGQCHTNLPWIRVYTPDGAILYEECAAEIEFEVNLCAGPDADNNIRWYMYSEGLSSSQFRPLETGDYGNLDNTDAIIVAENLNNNNLNLFTSTGRDLVVWSTDKRFITDANDKKLSINLALSTNEIYPAAGVYWQKINDFVFGDNYSLFVLDLSGNRVVKYNAEGFFNDNNILENELIFVDTIGGLGGQDAENLFYQPRSIDFYNSHLYVLDSGNGCIKMFDNEFNWVKTYRLFRDFLTDYPIHLSHDKNGNMYVLTTQNKILKYDTNFQNKVEIPLDSLSAQNESYIKLSFSPTDENIFYVLSNKNIYKKLVSQPDEDVGKYLPYLLRGSEEDTYSALYSLPINTGDINFVFSKSPNGAGKVIAWFDNINLFDVLSNNNFDIYTFDEIKINRGEYLQNWVFNKAVSKMLVNHMRLRDQITGRFLAKRDSKNNITFRGTRYFTPTELDILRFEQDVTNYIGMNETFQNNIVNRCLEKIFSYQETLANALGAEISTSYDRGEIVFIA